MQPKFYQNLGPFSLGEIERLIKCKPSDCNKDLKVKDFVGAEKSEKNDLTYLADNYYKDVDKIKSNFVIVSNKNKFNFKKDKNLFIVDNVHESVAILSNIFFKEMSLSELDKYKTKIYEPSNISKNAIISKGVTIGENVRIESGVFINYGCSIGKNVFIQNNTVISNAIIGDDVEIGRNCSIGQHGFGFAISKNNNYKIFHKGRVILQNKVSIGANCCIDRGSFEDTLIGENTFFDNLCHVAHNVQIGNNCVFAAQTGIAGSAKIGNNVMTGGQVGIAGHINVGGNVHIAAKSGVVDDIDPNKSIMGYPAIDKFRYIRNYKKNYGRKN